MQSQNHPQNLLPRVYRRHLKIDPISGKPMPCRKKGEGYSLCLCPLYFDWTPPGSKKRKRRSLHTGDPREAQRRLKDILYPENASPDTPTSAMTGITLRDAVAAYINRTGIEETTRLTAGGILNRLIIFVNDPTFRLSQLTEQHCATFVRSWKGKNSSKETYFRYFKSFLKWCIKPKRYITTNPLEYVERPRNKDSELKEPLTQAQQDRLLHFAETWNGGSGGSQFTNTPEKREFRRLFALAAIRVMLVTGLRVSDVARLRWSQIDTATRYLTVRATKKSKEPVRALLPKSLLALLQQLPVRKEDYIFNSTPSARRSNPFRNTEQLIYLYVRAVGEAAGLYVTPHLLRHTFAVRALENGAELRTVQILLGHRNYATTEKNYAKFSRGQQKLLDSATAFLQDREDDTTTGEAPVNPMEDRRRYS